MTPEHPPVPPVEAPAESQSLDQRLGEMGEPEIARYVREAQERRRRSVAGHIARLIRRPKVIDEDHGA